MKKAKKLNFMILLGDAILPFLIVFHIVYNKIAYNHPQTKITKR